LRGQDNFWLKKPLKKWEKIALQMKTKNFKTKRKNNYQVIWINKLFQKAQKLVADSLVLREKFGFV